MLINLYGTQELDTLKEDPERTGVAAGPAAAPWQQVSREGTSDMTCNSSWCSPDDLRDVK